MAAHCSSESTTTLLVRRRWGSISRFDGLSAPRLRRRLRVAPYQPSGRAVWRWCTSRSGPLREARRLFARHRDGHAEHGDAQAGETIRSSGVTIEQLHSGQRSHLVEGDQLATRLSAAADQGKAPGIRLVEMPRRHRRRRRPSRSSARSPRPLPRDPGAGQWTRRHDGAVLWSVDWVRRGDWIGFVRGPVPPALGDPPHPGRRRGLRAARAPRLANRRALRERVKRTVPRPGDDAPCGAPERDSPSVTRGRSGALARRRRHPGDRRARRPTNQSLRQEPLPRSTG